MKAKKTFYARYGKRWFDLLLTIPGYVAISPLIGLIALLVRLQLGSPVLFKQVRPGLHGKPFTIYKFRTMTEARDQNGRLLPDAQRLTKLGRFLRATSLDELPELWNVIKGDMSLVGPRPLLMQYLDRYTHEQARRHEARPGITGWAQLNGRNEVFFSTRLNLDVWYVNNFSFLVDLNILLLTMRLVIKRQGVIADQDVHEIDDLGLYCDSIGIADEKIS